MSVSFVRNLGAESGVQLNPLIDNSAVPDIATADTVFATAMRLTRGRIDRAFLVNSGNYYAQVGTGETMRTNVLNEAWVQSFEALSSGATQAVVSRIVGNDAVIKTALVTYDPETKQVGFAVSEGDPELDNKTLLTVKHLGCFNDGIKITLSSHENRVSGQNAVNDMVTLGVLDSKGNKLLEFTGSLLQTAKDDYNKSAYLPDVIESLTDLLQVTVHQSAVGIDPESNAYGFDGFGRSKKATSQVLICFSEGTVGGYSTENYIDARQRLELSPYSFGYIASGGTQNLSLLGQFATLAFNTNKQFRFDISGSLTPEEAIAFAESLNFGGEIASNLLHAFWTPLKTEDPSGINGMTFIGTSALNIAYACRRNSVKNAKGFAAKQYPIAGVNYRLNRKGVRQIYTPSGAELSKLASAKINPVIYQKYNAGGFYVFLDSLTCAPATKSLRKLISVAEMSTTIDEVVVAQGNEFLQLPMREAIKRMSSFLEKYFESAQASGWLDQSSDPQMGGQSFKFNVQADESSPYDNMIVQYWLRYEGTARQIYVTHSLTR